MLIRNLIYIEAKPLLLDYMGTFQKNFETLSEAFAFNARLKSYIKIVLYSLFLHIKIISELTSEKRH